MHNHIHQLNNKTTTHTCITCLKQFSASHNLKKHNKYCEVQWTERIKSVASNKNIRQDEIDETAQDNNIDDVIDSTVKFHADVSAASNATPSRDVHNVQCLKEYVPTQCEGKHTDCHIFSMYYSQYHIECIQYSHTAIPAGQHDCEIH